MTHSGHIRAHAAQPVQSSGRNAVAGQYPFELRISWSNPRTSFGHTLTHMPQPLHRSILIVAIAMFINPLAVETGISYLEGIRQLRRII